MTAIRSSFSAGAANHISGLLGIGLICCALGGLLLSNNMAVPFGSVEQPASTLAELPSGLDEFTVHPAVLVEATGESAEERNAEIPLVKTSVGLPQPFRAIRRGTASHKTALHCLTEAIYYEAANESIVGKRAVAQTILNRVAHFAYPSTVCGVVYQGWDQPVCQFSYTCDGSLARRPLARLWDESRKVAEAALSGHVEPSVGTATHYHADYVLPYWAHRLEKVHVEGRHIFYRFKGRAGHAVSLNAHWGGHEFYPDAAAQQLALAEDNQLHTGLAAAKSAHLERGPTERRTDNDVGGRLNPASGWQLAIPNPVEASMGLQAALDQQRGAEIASKGPTVGQALK